MEIQNKLFYHIHQKNEHSKKWKVGKKLIAGEQTNYFSRLNAVEIMRINDVVTKGKPYINDNVKLFREKSEELFYCFSPLSASKEELLKELKFFFSKSVELNNILIGYLRLINEMIFEMVRKREYIHLPSRHNCIWLCKKQDVLKWRKYVLQDDEHKQAKIFVVKATGKIHKADGSWINPEIRELADAFKIAENYWSGKSNPKLKQRLTEYLFHGEIEVLDEVSSEFGLIRKK